MNQRSENFTYFGFILLLAILPVYNALVNGASHQQLQHHLDFLKGRSVYFNPWQYRVLAPVLVESFHRFLALSLYKLVPVPDAYNTTFKFFRVLQNLAILLLADKLYRLFTSNQPLRLLALVLLGGSMHAAAYGSDMAFNTYFEIFFYLIAVWLIFSGANRWWFLPLMLLASLNRETCLFIPFILLIDFRKWNGRTIRVKNTTITICCLAIYLAVFMAIRSYYGYQPPTPIGIETGWPIFRFNLTDPVTILQLFATLSILPAYAFFQLRKVDFRLRILFWLVVPAWFAVHLWLVWARETRIFLVPLVIVIIPIVLDLIQKSFERSRTI